MTRREAYESLPEDWECEPEHMFAGDYGWEFVDDPGRVAAGTPALVFSPACPAEGRPQSFFVLAEAHGGAEGAGELRDHWGTFGAWGGAIPMLGTLWRQMPPI